MPHEHATTLGQIQQERKCSRTTPCFRLALRLGTSTAAHLERQCKFARMHGLQDRTSQCALSQLTPNPSSK
jgi:hypothetical protein